MCDEASFVRAWVDHVDFPTLIAVFCDYRTVVAMSQVSVSWYLTLACVRKRLCEEIPWSLIVEYVMESGYRSSIHCSALVIGEIRQSPLDQCSICSKAEWCSFTHADEIGQLYSDIGFRSSSGTFQPSTSIAAMVWSGRGGTFLTSMVSRMQNYSTSCDCSLPWVFPCTFSRAVMESPSTYLEVLLPKDVVRSREGNPTINYRLFPSSYDVYDDVIVSVGRLPTLQDDTPTQTTPLQTPIDKFKNIRLDPENNLVVGWKIRKSYWSSYYSVSAGSSNREQRIYDYDGIDPELPPIKRRILW